MTGGESEGAIVRTAREEDHGRIMAVLPAWWGGRDLRASLPRVFLVHFSNTSFVVENHSELLGFLVGFFSPARNGEAYIHFCGIHPAYRRQGWGRRLYERFFDICRKNGRFIVRACTSPVNRDSIAYHWRIGFSIVPGDDCLDGVPVFRDYNRPGDPKVLFVRDLSRADLLR